MKRDYYEYCPHCLEEFPEFLTDISRRRHIKNCGPNKVKKDPNKVIIQKIDLLVEYLKNVQDTNQKNETIMLEFNTQIEKIIESIIFLGKSIDQINDRINNLVDNQEEDGR